MLFKIGSVQYVCTVSVTLSSMVGNLGWEEEGAVKRCIKEHITRTCGDQQDMHSIAQQGTLRMFCSSDHYSLICTPAQL